jgi:hypothetical protein
MRMPWPDTQDRAIATACRAMLDIGDVPLGDFRDHGIAARSR